MNNTRQGHAWLFGLFVMLLTACAVAPGELQVKENASQTAGFNGYARDRVLVIAHRGASGLRPEHTLEAYRLAIRQGADFIEPDLVMTKDGVLVARHDPWLSDSTNVADKAEFADRKRTIKGPNGQEISDWWVFDFTLEELKTLKARQVREGRTKAFDDRYDIPTFDEIVALAEEESAFEGRKIGLYPEAKWPSEHAAVGLDMQDAVIKSLAKHDLDSADAEIFVQCFDPQFLMAMNKLTDVKLVQLDFENPNQPGAPTIPLERIATYADAVGPYKGLLFDIATGEATDYGARAAQLGLNVHAWTFRSDDLPVWAEETAVELRAAVEAGATGVFTDFPGSTIEALFLD